MTNVTRVGDTCVPGPSGGIPTNAATGSPNVFANDLPVHRVDDSWVLPNANHKTITGSPDVFINGKQVARIFDQTNTGAIINVGSPNVYANESFMTVAGVIIPSNQNSFKNAEPLIESVGHSGIDDEFEVNDGTNMYPPLPQTTPPAPIPPKEIEHDDDERPAEPPAPPVSDCSLITLPINYDFQLSPNFKLRNFSINCIFPHTIKAQNGLTESEIVCNLKALAENVVEPMRAQFGSFRINSGFRTRQNGRSQHEKGQACDIQFPSMSYNQMFAVAQWVKENINYDQLLWEHGNRPWIHVSFNRAGNRSKSASNAVMTMYQNHYSPGLKKIAGYS
ncbi:PAAR motif protein [compost metagenome]